MTPRHDFPQARDRMVEEEVIAKGITDLRVIEAMRTVPRHRFVPEAMEREAYGPSALPIGSGQTISAPHMVGLMTQSLELQGKERILEVGTGSGYQAAILHVLTGRVITVERVPELARRAQRLFQELGYHGIVVKVADGSLGYSDTAPYDRIIVTAAAPRVPASLLSQLAPEGVLVAPVGERVEQTLVRHRRRGDELVEESICRCIFVPLLGRDGFPQEDA